MKVLVCVTQTLEVATYLEFTPDGRELDPAFVTALVNEADLCAVEEALGLVAAAGGGEVVLVSVGEDSAEDALRSALALGPERAVRVWGEGVVLSDAGSIAAALMTAVEAESPDLVLTGVQSSDTGAQSVGPALAARWGVACVPVGRRLSASGSTLSLEREFEAGLVERVEVDLPALVTVQVGANTPRYGTFKDKMRAKKADIGVLEPSVMPPARTTLTRLEAAPHGSGRSIELIEGGPSVVAARIVELVREAQS
ncbi:electron transfer flavoprotein subunit beta/FixA family protein [Longivirga aurantiaca]|uniref:Electron transfer flavoprotein subunit beta/FixA family protein n=1 Tax=Longivirga aurantiaca TaxID=1837743 RepID=A0ABW1SZ27_9ACTN